MTFHGPSRHFLAAPEAQICPRRVLPKEMVYFDFQKTWLTMQVAWALNNAVGFERINNAIGAATQAVSGVPGEWAEPGLLVDSTTVLTDGKQVCAAWG